MPGQVALASQEHVKEQEIRESERQKASCIRSPSLFFFRVYAAQAIDQAFQWEQGFRKESPLSLENPRHVRA
jgi:hypothetical protein